MLRAAFGNGILLLAVWVSVLCAAQAASRPIRLRNELIATDTGGLGRTVKAAGQAREGVVSGLYLIQFSSRFEPAWQSPLRTQNVELLCHVPENAFVARLDSTSLTGLQALPFVHWVGEYRADHKLHGALQGAVHGPHREALVEVSVMLSPKATPSERRIARGRMQRLQQESWHRFGGVLRGTVSAQELDHLTHSAAVLWIEPASRIKLFDELSSEIVGGQGSPIHHFTFTQQSGFDGRGVRVAVADTGLHTGDTNSMHPDLAGRVPALFFYGRLTNAADHHSHGTHVAGIIGGNPASGELDEQSNSYGLGVALGASIIAQRIFNGDGEYEAPPSYEVLTHDAVRAGADIASNSWGYDTQGRYDVNAAEFDALVRDADLETSGDQPYILEFSAGNAGPGRQSMGSPAVAKNVIATGATQSDRVDFFNFTDGKDAMASFSSRGPCEDGRIKPDVVAPGTWIASLRSPLGHDDNAWGRISGNYLYYGGTSQAGAHVSGAAAVFVQYYRQTYAIGTPSPALVKAALINSGVDINGASGSGATPNMDEGWGRVDLTQIVLSSTHEYHDQTNLLMTEQVFERQFVIASTNQPIKLTLAYTDVPGFPAAIPALVNDLDLELIGPDGRVYRGNQFENGESVPDAPSFDRINNVEGVRLAAPLAGEYRVRVIGHAIVQDARVDTAAVDQDFALVIAAAIPSPETGAVLLDRSAYTAPGRIAVKFIDLDLEAEPSISVQVSSATNPAGITLVLMAAGQSGVLTGSLATVRGPSVSALQIADGDWIRVDCYDASEGSWRTAFARADLTPPVISEVLVTNRFGRTVISWLTDEPANALVRYGTNTILDHLATNGALSVIHEVELTGLIVGRSYRFTIESMDAAGNTGTNDQGGIPYQFTAQAAPTMLLVDAYVIDPDAPFIPLSTYTDPLDQIGVSYDVWDVSTNQMPVLANLQPYQIIIWRINDSFVNYTPNAGTNTIPAAQQGAIQQHLNAGGSFFMASMEILARLGPVSFRSNALHVRQFTINPSPPSPCPSCDKDIGVPSVVGVQNDPITGALLPTALDYSHYPEIEFVLGPDLGDTFTPATNAATILIGNTHGRPCGLRYPRTGEQGTGRVVFVSFPLDALPDSGPSANNRAGFLRNVIQFLAPGFNGFGTVTFQKSEYRLPDQIVIDVADSDLAGQASVVVNVFSDSMPEGVFVTLRQTTRPGNFQGFVTIVSATNPPASGVLRGLNNDRLYIQYFDQSANLTVQALASVDGVAPSIYDPAVTPQFDDAMVSWTTSERTDALVQFGESALLGRTAYLPNFVTNHVLRLPGLIPDHAYFYRIVSRDAAGNTVVDDNGGQLYVFQTRAPLRPPFFDDLESGQSNWSVFPADTASARWRLGSPNNGIETMAHSPDNCWGSSLRGDSLASADTFLISPAIELTGGNVATLRFYHRYDFRKKTNFDTSESGQVLVITNSLTDPISLATYTNANSAWEEKVIDLTPFAGQVILLVWRHRLTGFESAPRAGWLLDDIRVSISNVPPGTIQVSNNLAQARFQLRGPISADGQGWNTVISNATPGRYVVTYLPVPYFQTPPVQTNFVVSGSFKKFFGLYGFPDTNANGMSDTWELQFFGTNSGPRTCATDSDGDGYPDCAEFVAGTNPTLPNSHLRMHYPIPQPNGSFLLQWPSVAGRAYQVQVAVRDFSEWRPETGWIQATGGTTSVTLPGPAPGNTNVSYRLEVRP